MTVGVSGLSLYVPPHRVSLERWCDWTGSNWDKVQAVVGRSFRVKGPGHSLYTMAASAVLQLIEKYDVDPRDVGMLVLGTESSTDNAAGAVVVRGMVDEGLEAKGMPRLARDIEVPEVKHACLGGIYGVKQSLRYLSVDGKGRKAIVVSGDIAEYERGSTGEPTQGAGAVAMLLEENPKLLAIDLTRAASASSYRGPDFRKPFGRFLEQSYTQGVDRVHDFPVFNGKYSTACYLDEVLSALDSMFTKAGDVDRVAYHRSVDRVFFHRPYRR
ncbi:MAG: hydroxymethylglutaryl-CoA synthase, partial [Myxococcota bacterium]